MFPIRFYLHKHLDFINFSNLLIIGASPRLLGAANTFGKIRTSSALRVPRHPKRDPIHKGWNALHNGHRVRYEFCFDLLSSLATDCSVPVVRRPEALFNLQSNQIKLTMNLNPILLNAIRTFRTKPPNWMLVLSTRLAGLFQPVSYNL